MILFVELGSSLAWRGFNQAGIKPRKQAAKSCDEVYENARSWKLLRSKDCSEGVRVGSYQFNTYFSLIRIVNSGYFSSLFFLVDGMASFKEMPNNRSSLPLCQSWLSISGLQHYVLNYVTNREKLKKVENLPRIIYIIHLITVPQGT